MTRLFCAALLIAVSAGPAPGAAPSDLPGDLLDDIAALSTPATAWWLAGSTGATLGVRSIEDSRRIHDFLDRGVLDVLADGGNIWGGARVQVPLVLGVWGVGVWADRPELAATGYDLTRGVVLASGMMGTLKLLVSRDRPDGDPHSFPSGHTAAAFSAAGVITRRHGGWRGGASLALAVFTALGRMEDRRHHASDTVAGAAIGWMCGRNAARSPSESGLRLAMAPGAVALVARW